MRFALPAVAAISGLGLLAVAFYGQPALYIHQMRQEWSALFANTAEDEPAEPDNDAIAERMAQLQQQVARLENELTARQTVDGDASPTAASQAPPAVNPTRENSAISTPMPIVPSQGMSAQTAPPQAAPPPADPAKSPLQLPPSQSAPAQMAQAQKAPPSPPAAPTARPSAAAPEPTNAERAPLAQAIPEKREKLVQAPPAQTSPAATVKPDQAKQELLEQETTKAVVQKAAPAKVPPPPPVLQQVQPQPPQVRPDIDDTKSVLARLRQQPPAPGPVQKAEAPPLPEPPSRPSSSASMPRLTAARVALTSGRIEDARRLLQEAQLQLVFRPTETAGEDSAAAARGATDVARALEALSANDVPLSRRYIDVALNDLAGNASDTAIQQTDRRISGYAPAYPPR